MIGRSGKTYALCLLTLSVLTDVTAWQPYPVLAQTEVGTSNPAGDLSADNLKRLENLEHSFFFKLFSTDPLAARLQRLEKQVFGVTMHGTIDHRLETLESSVAQTDPGTGKPLAPRHNPGLNQLDQKASTPVAPAVSAAGDQTLVQPVLATAGVPPVLPEQANADKSKTVAPLPNQAEVPALHLSRDRFAVPGSPEAYIREVTSAMRVSPQEFTLAFERAKAEIQESKWDKALSDLCDAISSLPNESEFYLARAYVYSHMGNSVLAREDIREACNRNAKLPKNVDIVDSVTAKK